MNSMTDSHRKRIKSFGISKITIEEDGWAWITSRDGKHESGLGDINIDVEIIDKRII